MRRVEQLLASVAAFLFVGGLIFLLVTAVVCSVNRVYRDETSRQIHQSFMTAEEDVKKEAEFQFRCPSYLLPAEDPSAGLSSITW